MRNPACSDGFVPVSENGIACGDGRGGRSEGPPIERVTGSTRDSDLRGSSPKREPRSVLTWLLAQQAEPSSRPCRTSLAFGLLRAAPGGRRLLPRKEVIQPQVPLRLPCYDFTPITIQTLDGSLLAVGSPASGSHRFRGVTGGVYKARERIHRGMLIRDY